MFVIHNVNFRILLVAVLWWRAQAAGLKLSGAGAGGGWVIDGNYSVAQPLVWARADTVVWLDLPRRVVMRQVIWRTLRRAAFRVELWNGNRERGANLFTWAPEDSVISWAWHHYSVQRERYASAIVDPAHAHLHFARLRSRREIGRFLTAAGAGRLGNAGGVPQPGATASGDDGPGPG